MNDGDTPLHALNHPTKRRTMLKAVVGAGLSLPFAELVSAAKPPAKMRPQAGDVVVFRFGERRGEPIQPADVPVGTEMVQAITMEPQTGIIRDGSRLNGLLLVRLQPHDLSEPTRPYAADGIVAYSSVCTHQGCDLTQWMAQSRTFKCYCHFSEFNAVDQGRPVKGPSQRKLAMLPLQIDHGVLKVAGAFVGRVGFKR